MAADEFTSNYLGGRRHAPKAEFAPGQQDVGGTSSILNAAGRTPTSSRRQRSSIHTGPVSHGGPLDLSAVPEIIQSAGLGPKDDQDDEQDNEDAMLNRDPAQPVTSGDPGNPMNDHPLTSSIRQGGPTSYPDYYAGG